MEESDVLNCPAEPASQTTLPQQKPTNYLWLGVYALVLILLSVRLYRSPDYDMDSVQYIGNAILMEERDPVRLHDRVYSELRQRVPQPALDHLLGNEQGAPTDQNQSRRVRAADPYRFAEFLPFFAIRPLYNQILYLVSKTGMGLVRAGVLICVGSYFVIGIILFLWIRSFAPPIISIVVSALCMISPPLAILGRETTSDAFATALAFCSLYLIFEKRHLFPGILLLMISIYCRTDFVVLAGPVLLVLWLQQEIRMWQAAVLSILAVASVLCINHFAGDYGIQMLYYRNFVGTPIAPGEVTVHFSVLDYLRAFRSGITKGISSFFIPFLLIGVLGLRSKRTIPLLSVTLAYVFLHFLVLPNWEERWMGIFYLSAVISGAATLQYSVGEHALRAMNRFASLRSQLVR